MADAVIVSTARTPIGKAFRGVFNDTHGADLGAHVIKHAAERAKIDLAEVEDVILGCAAPEGTTGSNVARVSAIRAGAPVSVSGVTVNRFCSSGLQTISMAAQRVLVDKVPVMIAGGLESVSLVQGPPGGNKNRLVNPWVQEHVPGLAASAAFIVPRSGRPIPLRAGTQGVGIERHSEAGRLTYSGGQLPLRPDLESRAIGLGLAALEHIAGLHGYVGIDLILGERPENDTLIEINARPTVAYAGLRRLAHFSIPGLMVGNPVCIEWQPGAVRYQADGSCQTVL